MSKHTDQTGQMVDRIKNRIEHYQKNYALALGLSEVQNKDKRAMENIEHKIKYLEKCAARYKYKIECKIIAPPLVPLNYNCSGCRKRKSGDYFWVGANLKSKDTKYSKYGWFQRFAKVCSKECGDLMILRLM